MKVMSGCVPLLCTWPLFCCVVLPPIDSLHHLHKKEIDPILPNHHPAISVSQSESSPPSVGSLPGLQLEKDLFAPNLPPIS
jgi:hypothetical protein